MPTAERPSSLRRDIALGLIQGPSELLPISSSAHTVLIPWLTGRDGAPAGERSRSFEVSLHAGTAVALTLEMAGPLRRALAPAGARGAAALALTLVPPALAGITIRDTIERRLAGPRAIAAGLAVGGAAMAAADLYAGLRAKRSAHELRPVDGLALGLAQAVALAPGVSRNGATVAAARALGFSRPAAQQLSWAAGLLVMGAAGAGETLLTRRDRSGGAGSIRRAGALAAFASTLLSARLARRRLEHSALWPWSIYRFALALVVLRRAGRAK